MKHFTLVIVLLAVFASVALADRPSFKKKPVNPVPELVEDELEKPLAKKPISPILKQKPESEQELPEEEEEEAEEETQLPKKALLPAIHKNPEAEEDEASVPEVVEESSVEQSEEVVEEAPAKKHLLGASKPKPSAAELNIQAPEHVEESEPLELEPPKVAPRPRPALVNFKA